MRTAHFDPTPRFRPRKLTLRNGRQVTLRGIREADAAEIVQAFERLSAESRYLRFMQHKRHIDPAALHQGVRPQAGHEFVFVATVPADDGFDIVGAARYVPSSCVGGASPAPLVGAGTGRRETECCEFAITVAEDWRGSGLATVLLASLVRRARHDGYHTIEGFVLADNGPMRALARRLGFQVETLPDDSGIVRVWRPLARQQPAGRAGRGRAGGLSGRTPAR